MPAHFRLRALRVGLIQQFSGSSNQQVGFTISNGFDDVYANLSAYTNVGTISLTAPDQACAGAPGIGCINNIATNFTAAATMAALPAEARAREIALRRVQTSIDC